MATYSMKKGGKEVGPASVYAGRAKEAMADLAAKANMGSANTVNMSVGNIARDPTLALPKPLALRCAALAQLPKAQWPVARWHKT